MLIIKNCNLINMAGIYEEKKDLVVKDGKIFDICDDAAAKYGDGHVVGDGHIARDGHIVGGGHIVGDGHIIGNSHIVGNGHIVGGGHTVIDAHGNYVTPGIVEPHCRLGVQEEIFRFEGNDADESTNPIMPQLRALDAINPQDEGFKMALAGGVTTAVTCPGNANLIGGTCAAVKTVGSTVDEMIMVPEIAFHMCLTDGVKTTYGGKQAPKTRLGSAALVREALMKARNYHAQWIAAQADPTKKPPKFDMKLHSLMRVFDSMPVKFTAKRGHDMLTAIRIAEEFGLTYTLENCTDAWLITRELKKHNVKCVIGPSYGGKDSENHHRDPIVGSVLEENGIQFASSTGHPEMNIELSMIHLTLMYKKGLSPKAALESATINAARYCGLSDRVGSLEPGKDADIVIWDGFPLDYYTSASTVLINGNVAYQK